MYPTKYHKATSVSDAAASIGSDGAFLSGGQTLLPTMKQHLAAPDVLVDVRGVAELNGISVDGDTLKIGAATTHATVASSAEVSAFCPALSALAGGIGDPAVRAAGTIGGSLANNDPAADYPAAALALGATIVTNSREIAADDYFQGLFTTALNEGEMITAVHFPKPASAGYAKFRQPASLFALVGVFVAQTNGATRVAVTGAGADGVFRHDGLEAALSANWSADAVEGVSIASDGLMSDIHGGADYRANLIKVMAGRAVS